MSQGYEINPENDLSARFESIFGEGCGRLQADFCITCGNADPGIEGGCFLRLKPIADPGAKIDGAKMLFQPIREVQPLSDGVLRVFCEGYNSEGYGFPQEHPKHGGWICYRCGYFLSKEESVDSREESLPLHLRTCPDCGADADEGDSFYSV